MKSRTMMWLTALAVIATLALPGRVAAQQHRAAPYPYVLIDLGTLGGPSAYFNLPGATVSNDGIVVGGADTSAITPFPQECTGSDCHVNHAFEWRRGVMTDLGALPGGYGSGLFEVNERGIGVGFSDVGVLDPLSGSPEFRAAVWQDGQVIDLGTLGGNESWANGINNRGQVEGFAANTTPDPYAQVFCFSCATQSHAFLWQDGAMQDLGTLGGPDSAGIALNERGQVAGVSFTTATPNASTGLPTADPFLWDRGHMRDLGTLGGTFGGANWLNSRGEVVGQSNLAGDQTFHPFLWDGRTLQDLGTLGGDYGSATWLNQAGDVVGWTTTSGNTTAHAMLWRRGVLTDLGTVPGQPCSFANSLNDRDQVVGGSCTDGGNGWLWTHGTLADLNTLVAPSTLHVGEAVYIDERGEIACGVTLPNGDTHIALLVPADEAAREGLRSNAPAAGTVAQSAAPRTSAAPCTTAAPWRARLAPWRTRLPQALHLPCLAE